MGLLASNTTSSRTPNPSKVYLLIQIRQIAKWKTESSYWHTTFVSPSAGSSLWLWHLINWWAGWYWNSGYSSFPRSFGGAIFICSYYREWKNRRHQDQTTSPETMQYPSSRKWLIFLVGSLGRVVQYRGTDVNKKASLSTVNNTLHGIQRTLHGTKNTICSQKR